MPISKQIILYADGGARGNPGPAGIGVVICPVHQPCKKYARYIGKTTNNQAEYRALIFGLEKVKRLKAASVRCYLDSELVVKQLHQEYRVKDPDLKTLYAEVQNLAAHFTLISFAHISRDKNKAADQLVNRAIDRARNKS